MKYARQFAAYILSFSAGFGVPLVALAAAQDGIIPDNFPHHSSSRLVAHSTDATQAELEALRAHLWALTEHGGTEHCNVDGISAPCADIVVFDETK